MAIALTTQQKIDIKEFVIPSALNEFKPDYAGMHQYIFATLGNQMPSDLN